MLVITYIGIKEEVGRQTQCSPVIMRQLRSYETSSYRKSRYKNTVRSEKVWPVIQPCIFTIVAEIP
jgi:hypothetical protein